MTSPIGRDDELRTIDSVLDRAAGEGGALIIEGEAGIGKTTLWREAVARADACGWRVLRARPAAAEAGLVFSTVADLLDGLEAVELPELPAPQRAAIDVAMLRLPPPPGGLAPRALGAAFQRILASLAAMGPVVVAVDDANGPIRPPPTPCVTRCGVSVVTASSSLPPSASTATP